MLDVCSRELEQLKPALQFGFQPVTHAVSSFFSAATQIQIFSEKFEINICLTTDSSGRVSHAY